MHYAPVHWQIVYGENHVCVCVALMMMVVVGFYECLSFCQASLASSANSKYREYCVAFCVCDSNVNV